MSGAIILGAGLARRFGSDKRRYPLELPGRPAEPMLCATARRYSEAFETTLVVLRSGDDDLRAALRQLTGVETTVAADAELGMGHSLAAGVHAARGWSYAFIALGDMPFVQPTTLATLRARMERALAGGAERSVIVPRHRGRNGHPVGFGACYFPALANLTGDRGARSVIEDASGVMHIDVDDPGVLEDLDRPP